MTAFATAAGTSVSFLSLSQTQLTRGWRKGGKRTRRVPPAWALLSVVVGGGGDSTVLFYNFGKHANSQLSAHGHTRRGGKSFLSARGVLLGNPDWSVGRTRTREGDRQPRLISCLTFHFHVRAEKGGREREGENNKVSESE